MSQLQDLVSSFTLIKLLKSDPQTKSLVLLGSIDDKDAIITIERSHFPVTDNHFDVQEWVEKLELLNNNDVYFWSLALVKQSLPDFPAAKLNLIYPATETHIRKYAGLKHHYVLETPAMYQKFTKPYIETMRGDRIKWVYNILFEGKELETFIYHDKDPETGFVLLPDMKWDRLNMDALYLCCIVNRTDITCVRDLNGTHIDFLKNLLAKLRQVTSEKYLLAPDQLRIFIHYQPSYYHFHIHVVNITHPGLGEGTNVGKAILLDDVISNIELKSDYYEQRTLSYTIGENHGLWSIEGFKEEAQKSYAS